MQLLMSLVSLYHSYIHRLAKNFSLSAQYAVYIQWLIRNCTQTPWSNKLTPFAYRHVYGLGNALKVQAVYKSCLLLFVGLCLISSLHKVLWSVAILDPLWSFLEYVCRLSIHQGYVLAYQSPLWQSPNPNLYVKCLGNMSVYCLPQP